LFNLHFLAYSTSSNPSKKYLRNHPAFHIWNQKISKPVKLRPIHRNRGAQCGIARLQRLFLLDLSPYNDNENCQRSILDHCLWNAEKSTWFWLNIYIYLHTYINIHTYIYIYIPIYTYIYNIYINYIESVYEYTERDTRIHI
jgi:hypothetical protein